MDEVQINPLSTDRFERVLGPGGWRELQEAAQASRERLGGRTVWNVNTTAHGGGVAEMLWSMLAYAKGLGVDTRWLVMHGDEPFFRVTKRIHNMLHGSPGDGLGLGEQDRRDYERIAASNAEQLVAHTRPGDLVVLHDPQTAGLVPLIPDDRLVVWRSHIGVDAPNDIARQGWAFVRGYFEHALRYVFTRREYAPAGLDPDRIVIIPPSIDAFSPKNQDLPPGTVRAILGVAGFVEGVSPDGDRPAFIRVDGTVGEVRRAAVLVGGAPPADAPLILQVSRWDRLKDPVGVIRGFAEHAAREAPDAHLMYAGPAASGVADDPEGAETLEETRRAWAALPEDVRARVHLANLPMEDAGENAAIVNALQRHATIVVQKSLAEGFGLTVAEAMWKARPVVASGIGGIQDQIENGRSGILLADPADLAAYGAALVRLLHDRAGAEQMGVAAHERVREQFLNMRHLIQYEHLFETLL
jgi:trehalose synthase